MSNVIKEIEHSESAKDVVFLSGKWLRRHLTSPQLKIYLLSKPMRAVSIDSFVWSLVDVHQNDVFTG